MRQPKGIRLFVGAVVAAAVFAALVHAVLVATHLSQPAAITVQGMTLRRFWATGAIGFALVGVVIAWLSLRHPGYGRWSATAALAAALIAIVNGALNLAMATGGPGTGNGVVGAAAAVVLGMLGAALAGAALTRTVSRS